MYMALPAQEIDTSAPPVVKEETEEERKRRQRREKIVGALLGTPARRGIRVAEQLTQAIDKKPQSPLKWALGSAAAGLVCVTSVYGVVESFQAAVANASPGEGLQGLGYVASLPFVVGATREAVKICRQRWEEAQWHEWTPEEQPANESYEDNPASKAA